MIAASHLITGHPYAADVLFLLALICFVVQTFIVLARTTDPFRGILVPLGLALIAGAWLVL